MDGRLPKEKLATHGEHFQKHIKNLNKTNGYNQHHIDFEELKRKLRSFHLPLVQRLLPGGKVQGHEFLALNPTRPDTTLGSFKVNIRTARWADFSSGHKGSDLISLWSYVRGIKQIEAARELQAIVGGV